MRNLYVFLFIAGMHLLLCGCKSDDELVREAERNSKYGSPRTVGENWTGPDSDSYDCRTK